MITIPDSVMFYWGDAVNRAAVNVLAGSAEVPGDLTMPEAARFELAALAARRVRVEYWGMLRALWSASWEQAVRAHFPSGKLLTYGGHRSFTNDIEALADPSVDHAWQQGAVSGVFDLARHGRLFTRVGLVENEREGELQFYLIGPDQNCSVTDDLDLGPDWGDDGYNRRVSIAGLLPMLRNNNQIDPEPIASLALGAAAALTAVLS